MLIAMANRYRNVGGRGIGLQAYKGFTLVEILAALAVLAFGLTSVVALVMGSFRHGKLATDRNAAMVILAEAGKRIEQEHLITKDMTDFLGRTVSNPEEIGQFIQTLRDFDVGPSCHYDNRATDYADVSANGALLLQPAELSGTDLNQWPYSTALPMKMGGRSYRVLYRLEKHPHWSPHLASGAPVLGKPENNSSVRRGLYLLTMVCYFAPDQNYKTWKQISDPLILQLRSR